MGQRRRRPRNLATCGTSMRPLGRPLASDVEEAADSWCLRPGILAAFFFNILSLSRVSHHEARLLNDPLVQRSRQLQCHRRRIILLVADGLEVTSRNRHSYRTFPQVESVAEQCRRLLQAQGGTVAVPPLVPRWYYDFVPFPIMENNRKPRSKPGFVL